MVLECVRFLVLIPIYGTIERGLRLGRAFCARGGSCEALGEPGLVISWGLSCLYLSGRWDIMEFVLGTKYWIELYEIRIECLREMTVCIFCLWFYAVVARSQGRYQNELLKAKDDPRVGEQ